MTGYGLADVPGIRAGHSTDRPADVRRICAAVALCVGRAIVRGIQKATGLDGVPGGAELGAGVVSWCLARREMRETFPDVRSETI